MTPSLQVRAPSPLRVPQRTASDSARLRRSGSVARQRGGVELTPLALGAARGAREVDARASLSSPLFVCSPPRALLFSSSLVPMSAPASTHGAAGVAGVVQPWSAARCVRQ